MESMAERWLRLAEESPNTLVGMGAKKGIPLKVGVFYKSGFYTIITPEHTYEEPSRIKAREILERVIW